MRRRLLPLAAATALTAAGLSVPVTAAPAHAEISCLDESASGTPRYDARFDPSHAVPATLLAGYVPQGLATWRDYNGPGADLLLVSAYDERDADTGGPSQHRAVLQGVDQRNGAVTRPVSIAKSHAGGVVVHRYGVFVSGTDGTRTVRRYPLDSVRARLRGQVRTPLEGTASAPLYGASFLAVEGDVLFAGRFNRDARDWMQRYRIGSNGSLTPLGSRIQVPRKTQGLLVLPDHYVFSTSWTRGDRGNLYVVRKGYTARIEDSASYECVRAPAMAEGVTLSRGRVYHLFESGASHYAEAASRPSSINKRLQVADRSEVLGLLGVR